MKGGHTKAASYRSFMSQAAELGTDAAVQIARLELANIRATHAFASEHRIPCDSTPCQTIDVIYDAAAWEAAHEGVAAMRDAMPGDDASVYEFFSPEEVRERFHCGKGGDEGVCGGVGYEAGSISAYRFVVGLLKLCLAKGLNLQTRTPAQELLRREDGKWQATTPRGVVVAQRAVLATNGYTAALAKRFQGSVVPLRGQITMHRAGSKMPPDGLGRTYSFIYDGGYEYMVPQPRAAACAGDIVMGGGLAKAEDQGLNQYGTTDDASLDGTISAYLRETTPRYFGDGWGEDAPEGRIRAEWTGIMGYTPDGRPFVGQVPGEEGLFVSVGFVGHGMGE
jgi:glycine/D-amino acid oxidase-like deaminating enzyme